MELFQMRWKATWRISILQETFGSIYRGKDGYLIQGFEKSEIDKEDRKKQEILNSFLERNSQLQSYVMLVPTASWILKDLLPSGAPQGDEKSWYESWLSTSKISELSNVTVVDCADELVEAAKTNQIYYRTDHHWTTYGASAAFKELAKQMDIPYEEDDFEAYTVHTKFQGTMMSSSGFYSGTKDTIDLYLPKEPETEHRQSKQCWQSGFWWELRLYFWYPVPSRQ